MVYILYHEMKALSCWDTGFPSNLDLILQKSPQIYDGERRFGFDKIKSVNVALCILLIILKVYSLSHRCDIETYTVVSEQCTSNLLWWGENFQNIEYDYMIKLYYIFVYIILNVWVVYISNDFNIFLFSSFEQCWKILSQCFLNNWSTIV